MTSTQIKRIDLLSIEQQTTFNAIVKSSEPVFKTIVKAGESVRLAKTISGIAAIFFTDNFPEQDNTSDLAFLFSQQIIKREPTWEVGDAVNFFNFIQMRQDLPELKIYGNRITPIRLMEMVSVYNEHKAIEMEKVIAEKKGDVPVKREFSDTSIKSLMGKELERIHIRDDDKKPPIGVVPDEKYFNPKINENGNDNQPNG